MLKCNIIINEHQTYLIVKSRPKFCWSHSPMLFLHNPVSSPVRFSGPEMSHIYVCVPYARQIRAAGSGSMNEQLSTYPKAQPLYASVSPAPWSSQKAGIALFMSDSVAWRPFLCTCSCLPTSPLRQLSRNPSCNGSDPLLDNWSQIVLTLWPWSHAQQWNS